jgi:hypothetical protein
MTRIVEKIHGQDGFRFIEKSDLGEFEQSTIKSFNDPRHKILFDNEVAYGHLVTDWLYHLLTQLEKFPDPNQVVILFNKPPFNPGQEMYHLSSITNYLVDKLGTRGYKVEYLDGHHFDISNLVEPINPPPALYSQIPPRVVSPFLKEGTTTANYGKKIYLSRSKTTTPNGNKYVDLRDEIEKTELPLKENMQKVREENKYRFSDRLDDELALESYLKTLGFEILIPEDFENYQDQLDKISEAKILMSVTSASLHAGMVLQPGSTIVELCTIMDIPNGSDVEFMIRHGFFHEHYRSMAMIQKYPYIAIPNISRKTQDIIDYIESNPAIKKLLSD